MEQETKRNIRLGVFVIIGTVFLIVAFYFVGSRQNLFGSTFTIGARFYNVNGLMQGNSVRFAGIDVGTVQSLDIENDSTVHVIMVLDKKMQHLIRKNAVASVGTDGLMGNKLVNINAGRDHAAFIEEGNELRTLRPLAMDEMARTLDVTNTNMAQITQNLSGITGRISNKNTFWKVLMDTLVAENIENAVYNLRDMTVSGKATLINFRQFSNMIVSSKTSIGRLAGDTVFYRNLTSILQKLSKTGDSLHQISGDLSDILRSLKQGKGTLGKILKDT
ncbi:MAG: MlaD family protein, partial [Bacteroidia bacterium]